MSTTTTAATPANTPEMALTLANIARAQEETAKFVAEQRKLIREGDKLQAEALKFNRDRWLAPVVAVSAILGGGIAATLPALLRWLGVP